MPFYIVSNIELCKIKFERKNIVHKTYIRLSFKDFDVCFQSKVFEISVFFSYWFIILIMECSDCVAINKEIYLFSVYNNY